MRLYKMVNYLNPLKPTIDYFLEHIRENREDKVVELTNTEHGLIPGDTIKLSWMNPDFSKKGNVIFVRHFLERSNDPQVFFEKITSMFENGYIETTSPIVELIKGIQTEISDEYRGLYQSRYIVWTEEEDNSLHILPKYAILQIVSLAEDFEKEISEFLSNPIYWNNYYSWNKDNPPKLVIHNFGKDFNWNNYGNVLAKAVLHNTQKTNSFFSKIDKELKN